LETTRHIDINQDNAYSPFSTALIKAKEEDGKWMIYLEASNEGKDQQDEVMLCKALMEQRADYLANGVISWDHMHIIKKDPKYQIGEPLDVKFSGTTTLVKGFLYKKNEVAQSVWNNIQSGARLGASIGGGVIQKSNRLNSNGASEIHKIKWLDTAICQSPVLSSTFGKVSDVPFAEFAKSLMAGSGVDAGSYTGGRALTPESLMGTDAGHNKPLLGYPEYRNLFDDLLTKVIDSSIKSYPDVMNYIQSKNYPAELTAEIIEYLVNKLPEIANKMVAG
jgi:hypothetical protein